MSAQHSTGTRCSPEKSSEGELKRSNSSPAPPSKKLKTTGKTECQHLDYTHAPSGWPKASEAQGNAPESLQLTYRKGDMFKDAPKGCVLVHACNTQGNWGAGIAKAFKQQYPNAYADHHKYCAKDHGKSNPVPTGTAQLLAPRDGDKHHFIGCVFTSAKYGKSKDKPDMIVQNTGKSMQMLLELISQVDDEVSEIRMCKINSGKFGVPWEKTEEVIQSIALKPHWRTAIEVWEPEG
ncbi:hypothetical protein OPT61_g485 [Boeremia exigua]|uniref:Uncharacterized protein n=1 Tax=Boeremia exigua TaxID=749465 RepID=A0ACC2ITM4_9PLEO|nr:hypothetical protein OPT61_g485 [Boeremia exigua]